AFFSTGQFEIDLLGGPLALNSDLLSLRSSLGAAALLMGVVLAGRLLHRKRPPLLIIVALAIALIGKYGFTKYGYAMSATEVIWPQVVSGFGLGLLATPLAVAAYETLAVSQTKDASSLFVLSTQLGSALGIAVLGITLVYLQGLEAGNLGVTSVTSPLLRPFINVFWLEFIGTAVFIPVALLLRPRKANGTELK
ncbi:MAG: hypothetical protein AVDCRST_MAG93-3270, partial [uncultured Chloroflexia bacterium]